MFINYYEVLGVDRNATEGEIREVYKKLALKHHSNKSIENCVKNLSKNLKPLMDKYIQNSGSPAKRAQMSDSKDSPSTSFDTTKVEKDNKNCIIM
ncbi:DnaJ domain-containing protein [Candidatus Mesenet endosymbiont of Phosphuga atrata]|uniref:DnaJ domain-containing protein n=1 Tax=Candidatus Mesenet endosymbiont of Phosphuga atrata TaxID=3066221 RepID=UPI0030CE1749